MDADTIQQFKKVIEDIVDVKLKNEGITKYISAIVSAINNDGTVDVYLPPDTNRVISHIINKSGESLVVNDSVEICTKNGKLNNAWIALRHGRIQSYIASIPIGGVMEWYSDTVPDNWLLLNGQAVSRKEYKELFELWGTAFGEGDGSTTFNIPNKIGKVGIGLDSSDEDFNEIGKMGGSKALAKHRHTMTSYYDDANYNTGTIPTDYGKYSIPYDSGTTIRHQYSDYEGNGLTNIDSGNLQPYIVCNYIVRAKNPSSAIVTATFTDKIVGSDIEYLFDKALYYKGDIIQLTIRNNGTNKYEELVLKSNGVALQGYKTVLASGESIIYSINANFTDVNIELNGIELDRYVIKDCVSITGDIDGFKDDISISYNNQYAYIGDVVTLKLTNNSTYKYSQLSATYNTVPIGDFADYIEPNQDITYKFSFAVTNVISISGAKLAPLNTNNIFTFSGGTYLNISDIEFVYDRNVCYVGDSINISLTNKSATQDYYNIYLVSTTKIVSNNGSNLDKNKKNTLKFPVLVSSEKVNVQVLEGIRNIQVGDNLMNQDIYSRFPKDFYKQLNAKYVSSSTKKDNVIKTENSPSTSLTNYAIYEEMNSDTYYQVEIKQAEETWYPTNIYLYIPDGFGETVISKVSNKYLTKVTAINTNTCSYKYIFVRDDINKI